MERHPLVEAIALQREGVSVNRPESSRVFISLSSENFDPVVLFIPELRDALKFCHDINIRENYFSFT